MPRLTLISYPGLFPAEFKIDSRLDLDIVEAPRYTRQLTELIDINELRVNAYLDVNVFVTPKTELALRHSWSKCLTNIQCELSVAGNTFPLSLSVIAEDQDQYTLRLARPANNWLEKLYQDSLQDLNLGQFEMTLDNITTMWSTGGVFQDLDIPAVFTLGHYGETAARLLDSGLNALIPDGLYVEDCRPYVSPLGLLQQMFCEAHYKFRCPFLESEAGRRWWMYLGGPYFYKNGIDYWGKNLNFKAEFKATGDLPYWESNSGKVPFNDTEILNGNYDIGDVWVNADVSGGFDGDSSWFVNPRPFTHEYTFEFALNIWNPGASLISVEVYIDLYGEDDILYDSKPFIYDVNPGEKKILNGDWETNVRRGGKCFLRTQYGTVLPGSYFKGQVRGKFHYLGDTVEIAVTLADIKQIELLRGIIGLLNGKIEEIEANKEVWLHVPDDVDISSTLGTVKIPGFYRKFEYQDATKYVIPNSLKFQTDEGSIRRYLRLKFQDSNDPSIPENEQDKLHSILMDFGPGLDDNEEDSIENSLFQPTIDVILPNTVKPTQDGLWVPSLRDNEEPVLSVSPGYRILTSQGYIGQTRRDLPDYHANAEDFDTVVFNFEQYDPEADPNTTLFLYLSQKPNARLWPIGVRGIGSVVYGETSNDLHQLFWQRELAERRPNTGAEVLFSWDRNAALKYNFRKQQLIMHKGQPILFRPVAIKDIDFGDDLPILVELAKGGCLPTFAPCGCSKTTGLWFQNYSDAGADHDPTDIYVTFFEVDGMQYIGAGLSVNLGPANIITVSGQNYATNLVDALDSLNIPDFTFTYKIGPSSITIGDRKYFFEISYPSCQRFTILLQEQNPEISNKWLITEKGVYNWNPDKLYWEQLPKYYPNPLSLKTTKPATPCEIC